MKTHEHDYVPVEPDLQNHTAGIFLAALQQGHRLLTHFHLLPNTRLVPGTFPSYVVQLSKTATKFN